MFGRGARLGSGRTVQPFVAALLMSLFLLIDGPGLGAGREGEDQGVAVRLALRVNAEATLVADAGSEGMHR